MLQAKDETHKADMEAINVKLADLESHLRQKEAEFAEERQTMEEQIRAQVHKQFESRQRLQEEEVEGLTQEWELERKVRKLEVAMTLWGNQVECQCCEPLTPDL